MEIFSSFSSFPFLNQCVTFFFFTIILRIYNVQKLVLRFTSLSDTKIVFLSSLFLAMSQAVQTNGTQPLSKTWELSLYELQRTPQVM